MLIVGKMPPFEDFPIPDRPEHTPVMVEVFAVVPVRYDVLAFDDVVIVHTSDQLFYARIRAPHDAAHGIEECDDFPDP